MDLSRFVTLRLTGQKTPQERLGHTTANIYDLQRIKANPGLQVCKSSTISLHQMTMMHTCDRFMNNYNYENLIYSGAANFRESIRGWKSRIQGVQGKNYNFIHHHLHRS